MVQAKEARSSSSSSSSLPTKIWDPAEENPFARGGGSLCDVFPGFVFTEEHERASVVGEGRRLAEAIHVRTHVFTNRTTIK
jgi:hypothetical protein